MNNNIICLSDGRSLGWAEYGNPNGSPVLYFHGTPGSRLETHPDQNIVKNLAIRLIVPERPSYGLSDAKSKPSLLDWVDDVGELMAQIGLNRCPVIGFSGGGPYAAAMAYKMPNRVSQLALVSSPAPFDNPNGTKGMNEQSRVLYALASADQDMFEAQITALAASSREAFFHIITAGLPEEDQNILAMTGIREMYQCNMDEALRKGASGIISDMLLYPQDWGFKLSEISCETYLWQGMKDLNTPSHMGQCLAENIPSCEAFFLPDEAHFLLFKFWREVLNTLTKEPL